MTPPSFPPPDPSAAAPTMVAPPPPTPPPGPSLPKAGPRPSTGTEPSPAPRRIGPVVVGLAVLAIAMVLVAAAALPILTGDDDGDPAAVGAATTELDLRPDPTTAAPEPSAAPDTTGPASTAAPESSAPETTAAPDTTAAPATTAAPTTAPATTAPPTTVAVVPPPPVDEVPESKAVVRRGQIFLEGAVPTAEAGQAIADLAAQILGPDNVFNNYVVDPRASDPNLGNVTVEDTINFETESAVLLPEAEGLLNQALALMTIRPSVTVIVVGHTDDRGTDEYNLELSVARAQAVKTWLTDRGIDGARLTVVGKGESEPIADNATPEGQRLNRRIQFFIENLLADS